ncbi:hypothetical protein EV360DRAFT_57808 [Lentinula raphanica]|nr:hypothetical protein EV360DRAFT_57808 [Lentinula raphanica]
MRDVEENSERDRDNVEGFVDVLNEMSAAERLMWQHEVASVKSALFKTRKISFKIIHSTTNLLPKWRAHVSEMEFKDQVLPRDVATRWNSTFDMLSAFLQMKDLVSGFLDHSSYQLVEYILDDDEWEAIEGLVSVLKLTDDSYIYRIAIVLHPSLKLEYFNDDNAAWPQTWIDNAVHITREMWEQTFKPTDATVGSNSSGSCATEVRRSIYSVTVTHLFTASGKSLWPQSNFKLTQV